MCIFHQMGEKEGEKQEDHILKMMQEWGNKNIFFVFEAQPMGSIPILNAKTMLITVYPPINVKAPTDADQVWKKG